jgi:hypothetical protein
MPYFWPITRRISLLARMCFIDANDAFGAKITPVHAMRSSTDNRLMWNMCQTRLGVPVLWENVSMSLSKTSDWHGYLLSYLSKHVLQQSVHDKQFKGDPYDLKTSDPRNKPNGLFLLLKEYCIQNSGSSGYKFNDSDFRPSDLCILFNKEVNSSTISCRPIVTGDISSTVRASGNSPVCTSLRSVVAFTRRQYHAATGAIDPQLTFNFSM